MTEVANGVMPVYEVNKGEGGMSSWIYMLFFFLLLIGGGAYGGFGGGISNGANFVNNDFLYTNLNNTLDRGFTQLSNQNYGLQKDLYQGFAGMQQCCCETNRNIDALRAEAAQHTCAITSTDTANTQKILDKLCSMEAAAKDQQIAALQFQLQAAQLQLGNVAQTQNIISEVRPVARPAYIVSSPYTAVSSCGICPNA